MTDQAARDQRIAQAVFAKALQATHWEQTNLGATTKIHHDGYWYTVVVALDRNRPASIDWRYGWGGTEPFGWQAAEPTTAKLREVARAALAAKKAGRR